MKPCLENRKLIALLAVNELAGSPARQLRTHLENCEGCRGYLAEMSRTTEKLAAAGGRTSDVRASESFHRRVVGALRAEESGSWWGTLAAQLRGFSPTWRVFVPAVGAAVLIAAVVSILPRHAVVVPLVAPVTQAAVVTKPPKPQGDPQPTAANYRLVANQSLEKLDDLLTREGNRYLAATPIYSSSASALQKAQD
jgi:hypothetical protein